MEINKEKTVFNPQFIAGESEFELPETLIVGYTEEEIRENLKKFYNYSQPENKKTFNRFYQEEEIESFRREYIEVLENDIPRLEDGLAKAEMEAKKIISDAKASLNSARTQIKDLVNEIKFGKAEIVINPTNIFVIPAFKKRFTYVLHSDSLILAKVENVPELEQKELFNQSTLNEVEFSKNEEVKKII